MPCITDIFVTDSLSEEEKQALREASRVDFATQIEKDSQNKKLIYFLVGFCILFYFAFGHLVGTNHSQASLVSFSNHNPTFSGFVFSNFMHANLIHLGMNMLVLWFIISRLFVINYKQILLLITLSSISSNLFSYFLLSENGILVGASGFIYGLFAFLMLYLMDIKKACHLPYRKMINRFLIINIIFSIGFSFVPNIAWFAHLGGAVMGVIVYYIMKHRNAIDYSNMAILVMMLHKKI